MERGGKKRISLPEAHHAASPVMQRIMSAERSSKKLNLAAAAFWCFAAIDHPKVSLSTRSDDFKSHFHRMQEKGCCFLFQTEEHHHSSPSLPPLNVYLRGVRTLCNPTLYSPTLPRWGARCSAPSQQRLSDDLVRIKSSSRAPVWHICLIAELVFLGPGRTLCGLKDLILPFFLEV